MERADGRRIAEAFPAKLGWAPTTVEVFAGALRFSRYGFFRRHAMIAIARKELGAIDPSRDHVYTDWAQVDGFARKFLGGAGKAAA